MIKEKLTPRLFLPTPKKGGGSSIGFRLSTCTNIPITATGDDKIIAHHFDERQR